MKAFRKTYYFLRSTFLILLKNSSIVNGVVSSLAKIIAFQIQLQNPNPLKKNKQMSTITKKKTIVCYLVSKISVKRR